MGIERYNAARKASAAGKNARAASAALRALADDDITDRQYLVLRARIDMPDASWTEIGDQLGITKNAAASLFRRTMLRARKKLTTQARNDNESR